MKWRQFLYFSRFCCLHRFHLLLLLFQPHFSAIFNDRKIILQPFSVANNEHYYLLKGKQVHIKRINQRESRRARRKTQTPKLEHTLKYSRSFFIHFACGPAVVFHSCEIFAMPRIVWSLISINMHYSQGNEMKKAQTHTQSIDAIHYSAYKRVRSLCTKIKNILLMHHIKWKWFQILLLFLSVFLYSPLSCVYRLFRAEEYQTKC